MGQLNGLRCYLAGPIDLAKDHGKGWRKEITPHLQQFGVTVSDPTNFSFKTLSETKEAVAHHQYLKANKKYNALSKSMKLHCRLDLREVDHSHFLIAHLDLTIPMCGTFEEISWANRLKRPIIVWCAQGKQNVPNWLFGMLPHQMFFGSMGKILSYLQKIDREEYTKADKKRWLFA